MGLRLESDLSSAGTFLQIKKNKLKRIKSYKLFESSENFVGIHCSQKSLDDDDFYGTIIDEYYMTFKQVLELE
jgi:hypothetical protein